jgi:hypothetical protein
MLAKGAGFLDADAILWYNPVRAMSEASPSPTRSTPPALGCFYARFYAWRFS